MGPSSIYIDQTTDTLYAGDNYAGSVRMWSTNTSSNGALVLGENNQTTGNANLIHASAIWVDDNTKILYIVDQRNKNLQRWYGSHGDIIIGISYIHINYQQKNISRL